MITIDPTALHFGTIAGDEILNGPLTRRRALAERARRAGIVSGEATRFEGEFVQFDEALIRPAPAPPIPIVIGGRSDAALERAARVGDGWLAAWCSAKHFAAAVERIEARAQERGRADAPRRNGLQVWVGLDADPNRALERLAAAMHGLYRMPFEPFAKYSPCGTPAEVAKFLSAYVDAGCRNFNVMAITGSSEESIDGVGEIRERVLAQHASAH